MSEIPLKLYEILGFSLSRHCLENNQICIIENYYSNTFKNKSIFKSICLEYLQEINYKIDIKIIDKFLYGIEFHSNNISTDLKNIIKNYDDLDSIIFKGDIEEIYLQKLSFLKGCYLRRGESLNISFYFFEGNIANFVLKVIKDIAQNKFSFKIINSDKEGGGCYIKMDDDELLLELFNTK